MEKEQYFLMHPIRGDVPVMLPKADWTFHCVDKGGLYVAKAWNQQRYGIMIDDETSAISICPLFAFFWVNCGL